MTPLCHIAVITGNYPCGVHPNRGTFVRQLVDVIAELGVRCTVIYPWKLHDWMRERRRYSHDGARIAERVKVHRPLMLSVSNRAFGPLNTFGLTHAAYKRAVWRILRRLPEKPDAIYGHFLYSAGAAAVWAAQRLGCPSFVAVGESLGRADQGLWTLRDVPLEVSKRRFRQATGFVAVSRLLRDQLVAELGIEQARIGVFPNGVDRRRFRPLDRAEMRRKYSLPQDQFLAVFVADFDERKGVQRVNKALAELPDVGGVFVGNGPLLPRGKHVRFCGPVSHQQVPELLNAADVFVLPSRAEGSCNAIIEAMACGTPCIVSEGEFNDDLVGECCALRVQPDDVPALREAIMEVKNNPGLGKSLRDHGFARIAALDIRDRAKQILQFMQRLSLNAR